MLQDYHVRGHAAILALLSRDSYFQIYTNHTNYNNITSPLNSAISYNQCKNFTITKFTITIIKLVNVQVLSCPKRTTGFLLRCECLRPLVEL